MKTTFFKTVLIATLAIGLFSCRKDAVNQPPANEITDAQGLKIQLNWSLTDGSTATTGANFNFYVYKGVGPSKENNTVLSGNSSTAFEDKDFLNSQPDGEYTLEIHSVLTKDGKFNLVLKGIGSDRTYSLNDNNFTTISDGSEFDFLRITKAGEKYTITKLNKSTFDSEINDIQGLNIQMNWALTDGSTALATDLDFYVYKGVGPSKEFSPVISGSYGDRFENEDFLSSQPDGEYTLDIYYYSFSKNGKFNLVLKGKDSGTTYSLNDNNFTITSDERFDFIKITKTGTKYTITKLF